MSRVTISQESAKEQFMAVMAKLVWRISKPETELLDFTLIQDGGEKTFTLKFKEPVKLIGE